MRRPLFFYAEIEMLSKLSSCLPCHDASASSTEGPSSRRNSTVADGPITTPPGRIASPKLDGLATIEESRFRTPTATAIAYNGISRRRVLVGFSDKHKDPVTKMPKLVFPGGKLSIDDLNTDDPALSCITREVSEETGKTLLNPQKIGIAKDPTRDVRDKEIGEFARKRDVLYPVGPVSFEALDAIGFGDPNSRTKVKVEYGNEDTIVTGVIPEPKGFENTDELTGLEFKNIDDLDPQMFAAGHDVLLAAYKKEVSHLEDESRTPEQQAELLTPYLKDFEQTRKDLSGE